jgi:chitodextrinase
MQKPKFLSKILLLCLVISAISGVTFVPRQVSGAGSPAFVQAASNRAFSGTTITAAFGSAVTSGDVVAVFVSWRTGSTLSSITDNCGGSYTLVNNNTAGNDSAFAAMAYGTGSSGSCTLIAHFAADPGSDRVIIVHEISGVSTASPLDSGQTKINSQSSPGAGTDAVTSGNITTTINGDYIFGATYNTSANTPTISPGTNDSIRNTSSPDLASEDRIQSSSGAIAVTFTQNKTYADFITGVMAFQPASGGSSDTQAPTVPTNLSATAVSSSGINLSWTASTDNVGVTGYTIYRGGVQVGTSATNSYSDTGLTASTAYTYTVDAFDAAGNHSSQSSSASATTQAAAGDTTPPSTPTNLSATAVSSSSINLSWTASTDNVGVTGYKIFRNSSQIATSNTNSYSDSGLTASTLYSYTVSAYDAAGNNSSQSSSASATTQSQSVGGSTLWSGIIAPSRATDWSGAGIPGGIPDANWTQCGSTIAAYGTSAAPVSPAAINSAIAACGSDQYVLLGAGDFYLSSGVDFASKSNVVLRGAGANLTKLHFSAPAGCNGWGAGVCLAGSNTYSGGGYDSANWTGGYSQGTTQITLDSVTGIKTNVTPIVLDQCNTGLSGTGCATGSQTDNNQWFVCDAGSNCISQTANTGVYRTLRAQEEVVVATAISGSGPYTVTISPAIRTSNWSAVQAPQAWWGTTVISNSGVEDLLVDMTGAGGVRGITMMMSNGTWAKGVAVDDANYDHVFNFLSINNEVRDSYFFKSYNTAQQSYGIGCSVSANALIENNVFEQVTDPISLDSACPGGVADYNFSVNSADVAPTYLFPFVQMHSAGSAFFLTEGNIGPQALEDDIHGTHQADTYFRNYFNGFQPNNGEQTSSNDSAIGFSAFARYMNVIGNVLGSVAWHNVYQYVATTATGQACAGGTCKDVYDLGYSANTLGQKGAAPNDPRVGQTLFRWGNYDVVNNSVQWNASEVPSGDAYYPNPVPATQSLPASFVYSSKPSWIPAGTSWPLIGPDVSAGGISMCTSGTYLNSLVLNSAQCAGGTSTAVMAGHAQPNPAMQCYLNVMSGTPDGTGSMDTFNPASCYPTEFTSGGGSGSDTTPPSVPTGLSATAVSSSGINLSWTSSTDNVGVTGYKVFRGGVQVGTSSTNSYSDTGLSAGTLYSYTVSAYDAAGNNSAQSSSASATTTSAPDTTAPTTSITSPSSGTDSGTITFSATASDPTITGQVTSGLKLVTLYVDGSVFATSTSGTISVPLDTTTLTNGSHTLTASAIDNAGNNSPVSTVTITVNNTVATKYPRTLALSSLEGTSSIPSNLAITVTVLSPSSGSTLETQNNLTPTAGKYTVTFLSSDPQIVNIRVKANGYLSQLLTSIDTTVNSASALSVPQLTAGDLNNDNVVNALDYSLMNSNWLKSGVGDINGDGIINSLDFAILKNNFNKSGN